MLKLYFLNLIIFKVQVLKEFGKTCRKNRGKHKSRRKKKPDKGTEESPPITC
jgi:hypothetical protein